MVLKKSFKDIDRKELEELRVKARGQEKVILNMLLND